MDAMHFGMGSSCLQLTYESHNLDEALRLHDMLLPWTGVLAALAASSPVYRGLLSDIDMRWDVISQSVDCRTPEEIASENPHKSRYSGSNMYLS